MLSFLRQGLVLLWLLNFPPESLYYFSSQTITPSLICPDSSRLLWMSNGSMYVQNGPLWPIDHFLWNKWDQRPLWEAPSWLAPSAEGHPLELSSHCPFKSEWMAQRRAISVIVFAMSFPSPSRLRLKIPSRSWNKKSEAICRLCGPTLFVPQATSGLNRVSETILEKWQLWQLLATVTCVLVGTRQERCTINSCLGSINREEYGNPYRL